MSRCRLNINVEFIHGKKLTMIQGIYFYSQSRFISKVLIPKAMQMWEKYVMYEVAKQICHVWYMSDANDFIIYVKNGNWKKLQAAIMIKWIDKEHYSQQEFAYEMSQKINLYF